MALPNRDMTRFTFDCPKELHSTLKLKALERHQSVKDYLISLVIKDISENKPQFLPQDVFEKLMDAGMKKHEALMEKLARK